MESNERRGVEIERVPTRSRSLNRALVRLYHPPFHSTSSELVPKSIETSSRISFNKSIKSNDEIRFLFEQCSRFNDFPRFRFVWKESREEGRKEGRTEARLNHTATQPRPRRRTQDSVFRVDDPPHIRVRRTLSLFICLASLSSRCLPVPTSLAAFHSLLFHAAL